MTAIPFLLSSFKRSGFASVPLVNVLVEADPSSQVAPVALIARPGLDTFATVGTAPTRALWQRQGLFNDAALVLASGTVISLTAAAGQTTFSGVAVAGEALVDIDGGLDSNYFSVARIATGTELYKVTSNGNVVTLETFPDSGNAGATSVGFLSGYWLGTEAGTDAVYYQIPATSTWNPLQFASAEYAPDKNVCVRVVGEIAWLMGETTLEGWRVTGDALSPLEPAGGLKFDIGCRTKDAAVNCQGVLIFVDNNNSVRLTAGGEPSLISDQGLAEQIRRTDTTDIRASYYVKDQHPVYRLTLVEQGTWDYDLSSRKWTQANSTGYPYARAHLFATLPNVSLAADALSNTIYTVDPDSRLDGVDTFTVEFCARLEILEGHAPIGNLELDCLLGDSPRSGQGSDPLIGMAISKDGGFTYGPIQYRNLGASGARSVAVRWNALGQAVAPFGAVFKFQVSDPVGRRFSGARVNVP